ncbi:MAG: TlyA family RNA methyltransferase [Aggregatilineales bacterium]
MPEKQRLDILLHDRGLAESREKARALIMAGEVLVDGIRVDKAGMRVAIEAEITVKASPRFVSRGGEKLDAALEAFGIDVTMFVCADVGASTGGFTDCLLQRGASRIYAIDVGYGQLAYALRQDTRVIVMERTNARHLPKLPEPVDLVTVDASFISLRHLLPVVKQWLAESGQIIPLIKPQFEAGKRDVGKGGVVRDRRTHARVLGEVLAFAQSLDLSVCGLVRSPLVGPAGNVEFLAWLRSLSCSVPFDVSAAIDAVI